jgi:hypothetical protein
MRFSKVGMTGAAVLAAAGLAGAHLTEGSLSIKGGETFTAGQSINLSWGVAAGHGMPISIDVSGDGGSTWTSVKTGLSDATGTGTFKVTLPATATTHGKVRVCQGTLTACATVKTDQPSGVGQAAPYALVSKEFSITGTSSLASLREQPFAIGFDARSGKVETSFELSQPGEVAVQVFDPQGRLLADLIRAPFAAGSHRLSLETPRGLAAAPGLVFRIQLGESVHTRAFAQP